MIKSIPFPKSEELPSINKAEGCIEVSHIATPNTRNLVAILNGSLQPNFAQKKLNLDLRLGGGVNVFSRLSGADSAQKPYIFGNFDMVFNCSKSLKIISQILFPNNSNLAIGVRGYCNSNTQWSAFVFPLQKKGEIQIRVPLNSFRIPKKASVIKSLPSIVNEQVESVSQKTSPSIFKGPYASTTRSTETAQEAFRANVVRGFIRARALPQRILHYVRPVLEPAEQQQAAAEQQQPADSISREKVNRLAQKMFSCFYKK
jgi:hypothetical protein